MGKGTDLSAPGKVPLLVKAKWGPTSEGNFAGDLKSIPVHEELKVKKE